MQSEARFQQKPGCEYGTLLKAHIHIVEPDSFSLLRVHLLQLTVRNSQINNALTKKQIIACLSFDRLLEENIPRYFQVFYHFLVKTNKKFLQK